MNSFDLEKVYDSQIDPLVTQIIEICKTHKIPMFATFQYEHDDAGEGPGYCTTLLSESPGGVNEALRGFPEVLCRTGVDGTLHPPALIMRVSKAKQT